MGYQISIFTLNRNFLDSLSLSVRYFSDFSHAAFSAPSVMAYQKILADSTPFLQQHSANNNNDILQIRQLYEQEHLNLLTVKDFGFALGRHTFFNNDIQQRINELLSKDLCSYTNA